MNIRAVRSFAVTSVGIGGESVVRIVDGNITVGPERVGPSAALGGHEPTLGGCSHRIRTRKLWGC